jgi:hypothetical protein
VRQAYARLGSAYKAKYDSLREISHLEAQLAAIKAETQAQFSRAYEVEQRARL